MRHCLTLGHDGCRFDVSDVVLKLECPFRLDNNAPYCLAASHIIASTLHFCSHAYILSECKLPYYGV